MSKLYLKEGFVDIESILIMKMLASDNHMPLNKKRHFILNKYDIQLIKYGFSLFEG